MNIKVADTQLEYELQELYISAKYWLSEIAFVNDEIRFFKDLVDQYFMPRAKNDDEARVKAFRKMISVKEIETAVIKNRVIDYLKFLEPFINDPDKVIEMSFIEKHATLENDIRDLLESFKQFKKNLFSLAEKSMQISTNN